jgi:hypothetical protein
MKLRIGVSPPHTSLIRQTQGILHVSDDCAESRLGADCEVGPPAKALASMIF